MPAGSPTAYGSMAPVCARIAGVLMTACSPSRSLSWVSPISFECLSASSGCRTEGRCYCTKWALWKSPMNVQSPIGHSLTILRPRGSCTCSWLSTFRRCILTDNRPWLALLLADFKGLDDAWPCGLESHRWYHYTTWPGLSLLPVPHARPCPCSCHPVHPLMGSASFAVSPSSMTIAPTQTRPLAAEAFQLLLRFLIASLTRPLAGASQVLTSIATLTRPLAGAPRVLRCSPVATFSRPLAGAFTMVATTIPTRPIAMGAFFSVTASFATRATSVVTGVSSPLVAPAPAPTPGAIQVLKQPGYQLRKVPQPSRHRR
ncbi:hypothetical protein PoB_001807100 [Plakobranchus ocellatus]|uniref:Uncharacterized protein n=1 Tax=Plakobranchus ocellatus TaxID=259542 RepID=A0AAV3YWT7_9GAST|nr:hypothetical protein PoB_001807100 [Plakobranchus ocellatus]